jgi:CMP-N-acetylneuraminic acid synthetase
MKTIAYITIRLNSKRVPQKNIKLLGDKPLCYYMTNTLLKIKEIDAVYIYCSDEAIMDYIPGGAIFLKRDKRLDGDLIKAKDVYNAFISDVDADLYIAALTTAPFIQTDTIRNSLRQVQSGVYDSAFTAKKIQTFTWFQGKPINYDLTDVPRTQDIEPVYIETSGFFMFKKEIWTQHGRRIGFKPYLQEIGDIEGIDIDTPEDFRYAEFILKNNQMSDIVP